MPAETQPSRNIKPWMIGLAVGIVATLILWTAVGGDKTDPDQPPTITSASQFNEVLAEAEKLSLKHLQDLDEGTAMTEIDKKDLRRAAVLFDGLASAQPTNIGPYVGGGKCYQALGNDEAAIKRFQQGLLTVHDKSILAVKDTAIETHYLLSVSYFNLKNLDAALQEIDTALKTLPFGSPIYLSQRAAIYIQQKRYAKANEDLTAALQVDPNHKRSRQLLKLLILSNSDVLQASAMKKLNAKDFKGVVADCTKGLAMALNYPPLLALRAAAYIELGEKQKAQADVDRLLFVDPNSKDAQTLLKRLK